MKTATVITGEKGMQIERDTKPDSSRCCAAVLTAAMQLEVFPNWPESHRWNGRQRTVAEVQNVETKIGKGGYILKLNHVKCSKEASQRT